MKKLFMIAFCFIAFGIKAQSTIKTVTLNVKGNCEDCKERIENAADIKGVKVCAWDSKTKIAQLKYDPAKVSLDQIEKAIAKAGYEAGNAKADAVAYSKLPKCCQYNDGKCEKK